MIYNRFNREISCHHITVSLHHRITESLCQSVICLAPCHQTSQSFALPPATKPVSHLPCPLPLNHHITVSPHHRVTASPRQCVTASLHHWSVICLAPCHRVTTLVSHLPCPPATKPVSHLPCPLPPNQSVICLAPTTASPCHCVTMSPCWLVVCLAPCHQTSQSFALPPTTTSPHHCVTVSLCLTPCHQASQSFALPPATKPVSHLPCSLPPNQSVICLAPYHRVTASPRHRTTMSPCHCVTALPH